MSARTVNLNGDRYIRNVLQSVAMPHFDNHPLAIRPLYMDDNARPHHSRAVTALLQTEAVLTLPWPAMSPDLNPLEHVCDIRGGFKGGLTRLAPPLELDNLFNKHVFCIMVKL